MKEFLIILAFITIAVCSYRMIRKLDVFLKENRRAMRREDEFLGE